jgi:hypothetical protein
MSFPQVFVDFSSLTFSFRRYVPAFRESEGNASRLNWKAQRDLVWGGNQG